MASSCFATTSSAQRVISANGIASFDRDRRRFVLVILGTVAGALLASAQQQYTSERRRANAM